MGSGIKDRSVSRDQIITEGMNCTFSSCHLSLEKTEEMYFCTKVLALLSRRKPRRQFDAQQLTCFPIQLFKC